MTMMMMNPKLLFNFLLLIGTSHAFSVIGNSRSTLPEQLSRAKTTSSSALYMSSPSSASTGSAGGKVLVVSPPGGVGEVAAVKAACMGSSVRWFVVSDGDSDPVSLTPLALKQISDASGSLELAGASVEDLKRGGDALTAISTWCGRADGLVTTYDGTDDDRQYVAAIRLATQEASAGVAGPQVAILAAEQDLDDEEDEISDTGGGVSDLIGSVFFNIPKIPPSLPAALTNNVCVVRHGELFGIPESSPEFSPLLNGPRLEPTITEEYTMRSVRVDPFILSGNVMGSSSLKACRHAVGEAAALLGTKTVPMIKEDVSISSQVGTDVWTLEQWKEEFARVIEASGKPSILFSQEVLVDDTERMSEWLATKWAPAVLRTYDIAAIRTGARPVRASRTGPDEVEIVWQKLVDFDPVLVGKMILQVSSTGVSAVRGPGDRAMGFGTVSKRPLQGEDVLVRRLSEGIAQAVEKGLAKKPRQQKPEKKDVVAPTPVSSVVSAGDVAPEKKPAPVAAAAAPAAPAIPETGPRTSGARRSTQRKRRTSKRSSSSDSGDGTTSDS